MRVSFVAPAFYPAVAYGGPIYSTYGLARGLARAGCEVRVLTTNAAGPAANLPVEAGREVTLSDGVRVRYCARVMPGAFSPSLARESLRYVRWADVVHLTGVYNFSTFPVLAAARAIDRPVIWSPRGGLQRWEGTRRRAAKALWETACRRILPGRTVLHATSEVEARDNRLRMPGRALVIPNGIDVPATVQRSPRSNRLRLLYLGRLDPIKGIENLIEACGSAEARGVHVHLTIAGGGTQTYTDRLMRRAQHRGAGHCSMVGVADEQTKAALLTNSDVLVLPSYSENFGMVVLEALSCGVPVIASRGSPWSALETERCGLWVENDPDSLADAIARISRMPLQEMGERGRAWVARQFSWDAIAADMLTEMVRLVHEK